MTDIIVEIKKFISECWTSIFTNVCDAVVYIDHCAIECLHWYTAGEGYLALKNAGAVAVYEFGMYHFQYVQVKGTKKAVVISTSGNPAFYQRTIKMILAKNVFESCIVYCGAPCCTTNHLGTFGGIKEKLNYNKLKSDIKAWMTSENLSQEPTVNIIYMPIFLALLNKGLFVTPPFGDLMPPLDANISNDTSTKLNLLAYSFITSIDHRNHLSETSEIGVSLILIDRTLDLCTPTSNNTESFLTKILRTFSRLSHHDNDIAIDMSPVFGPITEVLQACEIPGCLASIETAMMDLFISQKEKKLLSVANQFLNDIPLTKDSPKLRTPTRISGHSLEIVLNKMITTDSIDFTMIHKGKLECILAIIEASTSQKVGQLELLTSLEKLVLQNLSVSRESSSILIQLSNIIRTRIHKGLDIENLLALLTHVYALAGTQIRFSTQQEHQLEESIADAIFEDFQILKRNPLTSTKSAYQRTLLLLGVNDVAVARETSYRIASRVIDTLRLVAEQRSILQDYKYCMLKPSSQDPIRCIGILEQITKDICCAGEARELRDLHKKSSSLISAGFNLILRGKTKRYPHDNPYILIYIVGGITAEEAKVVQEVVSVHNSEKTCIMLAGSRLLNPLDIVDKIFFC
ncbi:Sec1 family domain-containing protein 2 [Habropoda laboriosa]|uniref:Sec1 family domain-containing protein 2 n=1 Tax=Habropoda laboriosa TaxID=597456 RepID=A0A0L7R4T2_9HYME|nr:PREDICTED: sec1 family domain-containing protein 2-like [Habropoda laboriosa]KOC65885.1 Sec1 family domain-containing protein 2 [Habropoda laboriosa]